MELTKSAVGIIKEWMRANCNNRDWDRHIEELKSLIILISQKLKEESRAEKKYNKKICEM